MSDAKLTKAGVSVIDGKIKSSEVDTAVTVLIASDESIDTGLNQNSMKHLDILNKLDDEKMSRKDWKDKVLRHPEVIKELDAIAFIVLDRLLQRDVRVSNDNIEDMVLSGPYLDPVPFCLGDVDEDDYDEKESDYRYDFVLKIINKLVKAQNRD